MTITWLNSDIIYFKLVATRDVDLSHVTWTQVPPELQILRLDFHLSINDSGFNLDWNYQNTWDLDYPLLKEQQFCYYTVNIHFWQFRCSKLRIALGYMENDLNSVLPSAAVPTGAERQSTVLYFQRLSLENMCS